MYHSPHAIDVKSLLEEIDGLLKKRELETSHNNQSISDKALIQFLIKSFDKIHLFINEYVKHDHLYINHYKSKELLSASKELVHLMKVLRYCEKHHEFQIHQINHSLALVKIHLHKAYSSGSVYLFRHCDKTKRPLYRSYDGGETSVKAKAVNQDVIDLYDGISAEDVEKQAVQQAEYLLEEILLSPKPVRVLVYHSELPRTRVFARIILHILKRANHYGEEKLMVGDMGEKGDIFYGWTKEEDEEFDLLYVALAKKHPKYNKKQLFTELFKHWYNETPLFKKYIKHHQRYPKEVILEVESFLRSAAHYVKPDMKYYQIVIGISHAWIIDTVILKHFYGVFQRIGHVIDTASFCKVEMGEICYLGEWKNF